MSISQAISLNHTKDIKYLFDTVIPEMTIKHTTTSFHCFMTVD